MARWNRPLLVRRLAGLLLLPLVLFVMLRWFEHKQVYQPSRHWDATGADLGRAWENVIFRSSDAVELSGWFFPAAPAASEGLAVLVCHGNAGNISHRLRLAQLLLELDLSVFVYDYRGYGRSAGSPSEEGTYLDAEAAYQWLLNKGFRPEQILLLGESLGGAVATELAVRKPARGLILVSTFTSVPDLGRELFPWLPVTRLCSVQYDSVAKLGRIGVPLLILHSREDTLVGYRHAERLFQAAHQPKILWEIAGDHNDALFVAPRKLQEGIRRFMLLHTPPRTPAAPAPTPPGSAPP